MAYKVDCNILDLETGEVLAELKGLKLCDFNAESISLLEDRIISIRNRFGNKEELTKWIRQS
ncbi:hypothetical protein ACU3L3_07265 [Priestia endophytica]